MLLGPDGQPMQSPLKQAAEGLVEEWITQERVAKWHIAKLRKWVNLIAEALDESSDSRK